MALKKKVLFDTFYDQFMFDAAEQALASDDVQSDPIDATYANANASDANYFYVNAYFNDQVFYLNEDLVSEAAIKVLTGDATKLDNWYVSSYGDGVIDIKMEQNLDASKVDQLVAWDATNLKIDVEKDAIIFAMSSLLTVNLSDKQNDVILSPDENSYIVLNNMSNDDSVHMDILSESDLVKLFNGADTEYYIGDHKVLTVTNYHVLDDIAMV